MVVDNGYISFIYRVWQLPSLLLRSVKSDSTRRMRQSNLKSCGITLVCVVSIAFITAMVLCARSQDSFPSVSERRVLVVFSTAGFTLDCKTWMDRWVCLMKMQNRCPQNGLLPYNSFLLIVRLCIRIPQWSSSTKCLDVRIFSIIYFQSSAMVWNFRCQSLRRSNRM